MSVAENTKMSVAENTKKPMFIFVLGPPCAGKSTLCTALSLRYSLDHFSIGEETRSLISSHPTGHAARIKPKLSPAELDLFTKNLRAGSLGPIHNTLKYIKERMFPDDIPTNDVRLLVDGFPRKVDRWEALKKCGKDTWKPGKRTLAIILEVDSHIAHGRFMDRGRLGDVFERRYVEHQESIHEIVEVMQRDGVTIIELSVKGGLTTGDLTQQLDSIPAWAKNTA